MQKYSLSLTATKINPNFIHILEIYESFRLNSYDLGNSMPVWISPS